jgi:hypothetical protein
VDEEKAHHIEHGWGLFGWYVMLFWGRGQDLMFRFYLNLLYRRCDLKEFRILIPLVTFHPNDPTEREFLAFLSKLPA